MGTCYSGVCHDCKEFIYLDKFYSFCPWHTESDIERENIDEYKNDGGFIYKSFRLHYFMNQHKGHRIGVYNEHEFPKEDDQYNEVIPWPEKGRNTFDEIDVTDPKCGRIKLKTKLGDLYIDHHDVGLKCFFFIDDKRVDTLILPEITDKDEYILSNEKCLVNNVETHIIKSIDKLGIIKYNTKELKT